MAATTKRASFVRTNTYDSYTESISPTSTGRETGVDLKDLDKSGAYAYSSQGDLERMANKRLSVMSAKHRWDPNMPADVLDEMDEARHAHNAIAEMDLVERIEDDSPYPEVRAAVRNYDEDVPCNTIRAWIIGMLLTTLGCGLNMLFSLRNPAIAISSLVAQLIAYPIGKIWEKCLPDRQFKVLGVKFNFNPGPFNIKEHTLITVMANVSFGAAYATDTILAQRHFYNQNFGVAWELLFIVTTQMIGYGIAGVMRKFLVWPAAMIWPSNLVNTSLFYALHDTSPTNPSETNGWKIGRYRWFFYVFLGSFLWYWFPGYLAQFLSTFAFVTWIKPNDVVINQLFGGSTGLSLLPITFDWTIVTGYIFSPLMAPWHAIANTLIGVVVFFWFTTIAVHYSGLWYAPYLPISDSQSYDNTGSVYNVTKILTPELTLDLTKYEAYSPLFLSTTFSLTYGLSFAAISAVIVHTALFHAREIWSKVRAAHNEEEEDVHFRLMKKYREVPSWWYHAVLVLMTAASLVCVLAFDTHLSWWAFFLALGISFAWSIPIGMIQAVTNIQMGLNVFTEFIVGYAQPGKPLAMMMFKTYGYITMAQALGFVADLKLGHYMKIPPRTMFAAQSVATLYSCAVQVFVLEWGLTNIPNVCTEDQANKFTCPNGRVFFNASIIWGLIGPQRIFSPGSIYASLLWFWPVGALLPLAIYFAARAWPRSPIRYLNAPVILGGAGSIPPATPLNYLSWGAIGFVFNSVIRSRYRGWWSRYNYLTSAGLDVGLALSTILIFFALTMTNTQAPQWWGNTVVSSTLDANYDAIQSVVPEGQIFGPPVGTW